MKKKRESKILTEKSIDSIRSAIDAFNGVHDKYKIEICLILLTNAWELLGKAILIKKKQEIKKDKKGKTLSAEIVLSRLKSLAVIDENQEDCIQQVVSLRNEAIHYLLPVIPEEVLHHLFYFSCKIFRDVLKKEFPVFKQQLNQNFLSLSFNNLTTYADKVQKIVGRFKKNKNDLQLTWLLERGIKFEEGAEYFSQEQFEDKYRSLSRVLPHLGISRFIKRSEMVRIVPIQAPRNFSADITFRKGSRADSSLPIQYKKTDIEADYPFLTGELAKKLGKKPHYISTMIRQFGYKGNPKYHQSVRSSKSGTIQRYSNAVFTELKNYLSNNPSYNPYKHKG
jgi:hypothetical protein